MKKLMVLVAFVSFAIGNAAYAGGKDKACEKKSCCKAGGAKACSKSGESKSCHGKSEEKSETKQESGK